jgi:hypothetical protein
MPVKQLRLFTEEPDQQEFQPTRGERSPRGSQPPAPEIWESERGTAAESALVPIAHRESIVGEIVEDSPATGEQLGPLPRIVNNHVVLWVVLLSLGPLALPLFWISPRYRLWSKLLITLLTLGLTIVFPIAMTIYFSDIALRPLLNAIQDANQAGGAL